VYATAEPPAAAAVPRVLLWRRALASAAPNGYIYAMLNALLLVSADFPDRAS